jgi:hypothetical protein
MEPRAAAPALSIVVPTVRGWPAIGPCLEALRPQVREVGGDIVVADGSGGSGAPPGTFGPEVVWHACPGLGVFDLRRRALLQARGALVAVTEDHCLAAPGWCRAIVEAHARLPTAEAIKGLVTNGSPERAIDRAAFLMTHLPHLSPVGQGPFAHVLGISCTSFRREALARLQEGDGPGLPELAPATWIDPAAIAADERIAVAHVQSEGWWGALALQFHNARAIAGLRRGRPGLRDYLRLVASPILPWARAVRLANACWSKRVSRRSIVWSLPLFVLLLSVKGLGEVAGYVAGPGDSARRLQ